ncbi:MAG: hypothetical protein ACRD3W_22610, partial [Terriglobales bacterium]
GRQSQIAVQLWDLTADDIAASAVELRRARDVMWFPVGFSTHGDWLCCIGATSTGLFPVRDKTILERAHLAAGRPLTRGERHGLRVPQRPEWIAPATLRLTGIDLPAEDEAEAPSDRPTEDSMLSLANETPYELQVFALNGGQRSHTATLVPREDLDLAAIDTNRWLIGDMSGRTLGIIECKQQNRRVTLRVAK